MVQDMEKNFMSLYTREEMSKAEDLGKFYRIHQIIEI